jgi:hypothetical protein
VFKQTLGVGGIDHGQRLHAGAQQVSGQQLAQGRLGHNEQYRVGQAVRSSPATPARRLDGQRKDHGVAWSRRFMTTL